MTTRSTARSEPRSETRAGGRRFARSGQPRPPADATPVPPGSRPRRQLPRLVIAVLRPFFRYSAHRNAYVLRVVGNRRGPVLRPRR